VGGERAEKLGQISFLIVSNELELLSVISNWTITFLWKKFQSEQQVHEQIAIRPGCILRG
jgi:hypothetical protein